MKTGKVYLIGAGPGDPGLMTVRGLRVLQQATVVLYDRLVHPDLLAEAPASATCLYVGKEDGDHCLPQEQLNQLLIACAQRGEFVVRLKGGDPFVFGRGGEEAEALVEAGIPFEVVPGVSSAVAVPAYAGIPLTYRTRASSFAVITGHEGKGKNNSVVDWAQLATVVDTIVVLMGLKNLAEIVKQLQLAGRSSATPVAVIRQGTTCNQHTIVGSLETIVDQVRAARLVPPAVVVIGEVVRLRERLRWFAESLNRSTPAGGMGSEGSALRLPPVNFAESLFR